MKTAIPCLYAEYGRYTDELRMIPYYLDCLKPVERRVLYSLHTFPKNKTTKCARVVGDVIGKYHPHGDASTYGSLVSLVHRQYAIGQGNFGAINLKPPRAAAYRYCVTKDTKIPTEFGIFDIVELNDIINNNINVFKYNGDLVNASYWFNTGLDDIIELETENGYTLKGNYKHPILIFNEKLSFEWKELKDIEVNDFVILKSIEHNPSKSEHPLEMFGLLGGLVSEGWFTNLQNGKIGINNTDVEFITYIYDGLLKINQNEHICTSTSTLKSTKILYTIELCNEFWRSYFRSFLQNSYSTSQKIPDIIWKSNNDEIKEFLKLLFSGDGSVVLGKHRDLIITYCSSSDTLLKQIHQLLLMKFGIISSIKLKHNRLTITGYDNCLRFYERIGFLSHKNNKLKSYLDTFINSKHLRGKINFIPYVKDYLINKYKSGNKAQLLKRYYLDNRKSLKVHWDKLLTFIDNDDQTLLNNIINTDYIFQSVKSVIKLKEQEEVYCLRVDSDCHSFIGNGFINHNTECKIEPFVDNFAFELVKYVNWGDPENLQEEQPLYLTSPVPLGLIGHNLISGISFNTTKIPRFTLPDLVRRLEYLFQKQIDPNIPIQTIIPNFPNFDIYENEQGSFETILTKGVGTIILVPKVKVDHRGLYILGKPPTGISSWLKDNDIYDIIDLSSGSFEVLFSPKVGSVTQEFINQIMALVTCKITFLCNVIDDSGTVALKSIDELLLLSYDKWVSHVKDKLEDQRNAYLSKIFELKVVSVVREIINKYNIGLNKIDNIVSYFKTDFQKLYPDISEDNIRQICTKYNIKSLIEHKLDTQAIQIKLKEVETMINDIVMVSYNKMKSFLK